MGINEATGKLEGFCLFNWFYSTWEGKCSVTKFCTNSSRSYCNSGRICAKTGHSLYVGKAIDVQEFYVPKTLANEKKEKIRRQMWSAILRFAKVE